MSQIEPCKAFAVQPDEGESFWQPVPANGYTEVHVSRHRHQTVNPLEAGLQEIGPGGHVRQHSHDPHEELIFVVEGEGKAVVDEEEHAMRAGTTIYVAPRCQHTFINTGDTPLKFFWVLMPGGLSDFFRRIGRHRTPGEAPPEPFPRPENVADIEAETVYVRGE